jgi:hypothetical protein
MLKIRAFRAIDDPDACRKFIVGHRHVLESIGVKKVTSSKDEWASNPAAFVIIVESPDGERVFGGARVHVAGGTQPLPIEEATGYLDASIYDVVKAQAINGTGEICGLWNSREVAGMGIGSVFLTRACVIISTQIGLKTLFALCAPYTVKMAENVGYRILDTIGNKGTFYYPKLDLVATAMLLDDVDVLSLAEESERDSITSIRENLTQVRTELLRNKEIVLDYHLEIQHINDWFTTGIIQNPLR